MANISLVAYNALRRAFKKEPVLWERDRFRYYRGMDLARKVECIHHHMSFPPQMKFSDETKGTLPLDFQRFLATITRNLVALSWTGAKLRWQDWAIMSPKKATSIIKKHGELTVLPDREDTLSPSPPSKNNGGLTALCDHEESLSPSGNEGESEEDHGSTAPPPPKRQKTASNTKNFESKQPRRSNRITTGATRKQSQRSPSSEAPAASSSNVQIKPGTTGGKSKNRPPAVSARMCQSGIPPKALGDDAETRGSPPTSYIKI
ncbi:hypothetical protein EDD18DRAFT_1357353 [Armillaria luteobubalina]|uniref:Uncharacterized protein n=1 Tax=Armillaria luteobubalina TaxID=153913 RepID=A0AA39TKJ3_9AGAR|nr:hypothetical protein EDD18DRAFT_1366709 [Armillaria luteobubalina]KAK0492971.1 hypothetical protein EDD18DRAFT_1357353 [Armillaria luteobubalina]